jgi:glycosyltransferase involved in cell wall biosynthesis
VSSADRLRLALQFTDPAVSAESGWVAGLYYLRNCLNALAALPESERPDVTALVPTGFTQPLLLREASGLSWLHVRDVASQQSSALLELHRELRADVIFPVTTPVADFAASIGWIPDFQHRHLPKFFSAQELEIRDSHYGFLAGYCDRIACNSGEVLQDFKASYPEVADKGELLRFAVTLPSDVLKYPPAQTLKRLGLDDRVYVYIPNQFWVHKNHRTAFEAWRTVVQSYPHALLVCSGPTEDYRAPEFFKELTRFVRDSNLDENIAILGVLNRSDQLQVMRGAAYVLQPSLFEGWSTSIEEAKLLGKALIVSDITVHRDQCRDAAVFFPSLDAQTLAQVLSACLREGPSLRNAEAELESYERYQLEVLSFARALVGMAERARTHSVARTAQSPGFALSLRSLQRQIELDRAISADATRTLKTQLEEVDTDRTLRLQSVNTLTARLAEVEADRAVRLESINSLTTRLAEVETDRAARLEAINALTAQLAEAEADRAARLEAINALTAQLAEAEADRAARLEVINTLSRELAKVGPGHVA